MIVILACSNDETARRLATSFRLTADVPVHLSDGHDLGISVTVAANGDVKARLTVGPRSENVTSVVNRFIGQSQAVPDAAFQNAEWLASVWSALALFSGPVVNRPTRHGFFPRLEGRSLSVGCPGLAESAAWIEMNPQPITSEGQSVTNVHRLSNGHFVGTLAEIDANVDASDAFMCTPFVPERTCHLLLAGGRSFDLSRPDGDVDGRVSLQIAGVVTEARRLQATFVLVVFELVGERLRFLHSTPFPQWADYEHVEPAVSKALLEYLRS